MAQQGIAAVRCARAALVVALVVGFGLTSVGMTSVSASASASQSAASTSAAQKPFPIGFVIGGILVVLGIGGGIYGQRMRIRGGKPPRT